MSSSTKNIITGVVGVVAVLLVVVVLLVMKFGTDEDRREKETIIVSEIISELRTDENGETFFYTMVTRYSKPKYSSGHTYPSTKKPTTTAPFVELTAYEYDNYGKLRLGIGINLIRSPFDGTYQSTETLIWQLAGLHKNALTAQEYDDKELEAETYDLLALSAYDYDWNGKTLIA